MVSESCKNSIGKITKEEQLIINEKRVKTSLKKYGVTNNAQLEKAKINHALLYENKILVDEINQGIKNTIKEKYGDENYNNITRIKETFRDKRNNNYWVDKFPTKNIEVLQNKEKLTELFNTKNVYDIVDELNVHIQTIYKYLNIHDIRKPYEENDLVLYLKSLGITNIIRNTRKLLPSKKEIDIYLPDCKIAFEYNGVYWHHEDINHIHKTYHYDKFKECEKLGIQLITIFSNFWLYKNIIVKELIKNKLGMSDKSLFARKCYIKNVTNKDSKIFLDNYHIQGSSIRIGLYYNDELVSIMTFFNSRICVGKSEEGVELVIFASKYKIVGGASKLLKYYIDNYKPSKIVSYSDNEWSVGKLTGTSFNYR